MRMSASFFDLKQKALATIVFSAIIFMVLPIAFAVGETVDQQRTRLQAELAEIEKDI